MFFLVLLGSAFSAPEMIPEEDTDLLGRTAPDFELKTDKGDVFELSKLRGKPVVLAFWASWCSPCRYELPALSEFAKGQKNVEIYTVNVDRERAAADEFLSKIKVDLPIIWDNNAVALGAYGIMSMPTTYLIDEKGTVKWVKLGYSKKKGLTELKTQIEELK